jgi:aminoglycoside phosphotransferase (APT) family kinase protein
MTDNNPDEYLSRIVDRIALARFLEDQLGSVPDEEYELEHHQEGHSNETLFVRWGETDLVIRRPPPGEVAETAHDVLREFRVIDALQDTPVRVPRTVSACDDHSVLGCDFYVMERQTGDVIRSEEPARFRNATSREAISEELVDRLVEIHDVDYESVGLEAGDFGYPGGFTQRQVERWSKQIAWASKITAAERKVPELEEVQSWLEANVPDEHPQTLVHGDYKLDNVMFGPGNPPVVEGIFDWELAALGDPFTDLGWMLSFWFDEKDPDPPTSVGELYVTVTMRDGYLTREQLVERYEDRAGVDFTDRRFYRTLGVYKLAALGEMFFRRHLEGNSDDPLYPEMCDGVPELAERAMRIIDGEEPL